jgi:hypothetical protein
MGSTAVLEPCALDHAQDSEDHSEVITVDASAAPLWDSLPGTGRVLAWARDLRAACELNADSGSPQSVHSAWDTAGRAAILIGEEMRTCRAAAHRAAVEAGMQFVCIADDDVTDLAPATAFARMAPVMVFLEPGKWMAEPEKEDPADVVETNRAFQQHLAKRVREFDPSRPVVYVTSAFRIVDVVERLRHVGLFDRFLNVPAPTMEAYGTIMIEKIGRHNCGPTVTGAPAKLGQLFRMSYGTERREALALLRLQREVKALQRPLEFSDIVRVETHGFIEEDNTRVESDSSLRETAYHEAGHAAVAVIDSLGKNIPDFSSIVPSADLRGVVVDSYAYHAELGNRMSYASFRHKVRMLLAGRAAEELYLGAACVTSGCESDLEKATRHASKAFADWGFAPGMDDAERAGSNLAVVGCCPSASESSHVERLVRGFLADEYEFVKKMLSAHKPFVDAIVARLMADSIIDQQTLTDLAIAHVPGFAQEPLTIA